jgi:hypothetical protein
MVFITALSAGIVPSAAIEIPRAIIEARFNRAFCVQKAKIRWPPAAENVFIHYFPYEDKIHASGGDISNLFISEVCGSNGVGLFFRGIC